MSVDDPSDDELEREAMRDVPASLGSVRHAPKLSRESRAINPRAQLEAERVAQSIERGQLCEFPDIGEHMDRVSRERSLGLLSSRALDLAQASPLRRAPAAPQQPARASAGSSRQSELSEAQAWDGYVTAALEVAQRMGVDDPPSAAVATADFFLEQRRRRFG